MHWVLSCYLEGNESCSHYPVRRIQSPPQQNPVLFRDLNKLPRRFLWELNLCPNRHLLQVVEYEAL